MNPFRILGGRMDTEARVAYASELMFCDKMRLCKLIKTHMCLPIRG